VNNIERIDSVPEGGSCSGEDLNIWFPMADKSQPGKFSDNYRQAKKDSALAKSICRDCVVRVQCLSYGLYHESYGIWGGATERERRQMRRKLNILMIPKVPVNILLPQ
jgi:hypothetical protein